MPSVMAQSKNTAGAFESYRYYETLFSGTERDIYYNMRTSFSKCEKEFSVPKATAEKLSEICLAVRLDNPLLFHVGPFSFVSSPSGTSVTMKPQYTMDKKEYLNTLEAVMRRLDKILAPARNFSEWEKELFIHDYIAENVVYDKLKKSYSHEVTGPLCHGIGVCEGMSKTFKLMCDFLSLQAVTVFGIGTPPGMGSGKKTERHSWNEVVIDGSWTGVDVTFDASLSGKSGRKRYDFFNIPDRIMMKSHSEITIPVPSCTREGLGFYSHKK